MLSLNTLNILNLNRPINNPNYSNNNTTNNLRYNTINNRGSLKLKVTTLSNKLLTIHNLLLKWLYQQIQLKLEWEEQENGLSLVFKDNVCNFLQIWMMTSWHITLNISWV